MTNWPAYETGLRQCADLTVWLDEAALTGWNAPRRTTRGGQPFYFDAAIELVLTLQFVFHLALRQAEDFARFVLRRLGLDLSVPDHGTLSRRGQAFAERQPCAMRHDRPIHVVFDSTGLRRCCVDRAEGRVGGRSKKLDVAKRWEIAESVITRRKSGARHGSALQRQPANRVAHPGAAPVSSPGPCA